MRNGASAVINFMILREEWRRDWAVAYCKQSLRVVLGDLRRQEWQERDILEPALQGFRGEQRLLETETGPFMCFKNCIYLFACMFLCGHMCAVGVCRGQRQLGGVGFLLPFRSRGIQFRSSVLMANIFTHYTTSPVSKCNVVFCLFVFFKESGFILCLKNLSEAEF